VLNLLGGEEAAARSRTPEIVADAAYVVLTSAGTGEFLIDDEVLAGAGVTDLSSYRLAPTEADLAPDVFL
jgi:citronellol/citronellal dehydrogenase